MNELETINYYNQNAVRFTVETVQVNFESTQKRFAGKLPAGAAILDFGCGSGRDTKYFLSQGYQVDAVDGSAELCRLAGEYTGVNVKNMFFHELAEVERYDGIWACSSILHLPLEELADVMRKMVAALKHNGIIYASFKYGKGMRNDKGRLFYDYDEIALKNIAVNSCFWVEDIFVTQDVRNGRENEQWINVLARKIIP